MDAKEQCRNLIESLKEAMEYFGEPEDHRESILYSSVEDAVEELKGITSKM